MNLVWSKRLGLLWLAAATLVAWPVRTRASTAESIGSLYDRALVLHEAWAEAHLSMDADTLGRQWQELLKNLRKSLPRGVRMEVTGGSGDWQIELRLRDGAMAVFADPTGARISVHGRPRDTVAKDLLAVYPARRHFDCDGKPLNPKATGIPVQGQGRTCSPDRAASEVKTKTLASDMGARLRPSKGLDGCYDVMSELGNILWPSQMLVELPGRPYAKQRLNDENMWLQYLTNRTLFLMDRKQPKIYLLEPR